MDVIGRDPDKATDGEVQTSAECFNKRYQDPFSNERHPVLAQIQRSQAKRHALANDWI